MIRNFFLAKHLALNVKQVIDALLDVDHHLDSEIRLFSNMRVNCLK